MKYIDHNLYIDACEQTRNRIHDLVFVDEEDAFSANRIVPMPEDVVEVDAWRWKNWGTTSEAFNADWEETNHTVWFQTKYEDGSTLVRALSKRFPDATFEVDTLDDDGNVMNFYKIINGEIVEHKEFCEA